MNATPFLFCYSPAWACALFRDLVDCFFELLAAIILIFENAETGRAGGEEDDVSGGGRAEGGRHRLAHRSRHDRRRIVREEIFQFLARRAFEEDHAFHDPIRSKIVEFVRERLEVQLFVVAAGDEDDRALLFRERPERRDRRIGGRRVRIVIEGDAAFFAPALDRIQLPNRTTFDTPAAYYATAFHELTHWTGHKDRLDRNQLGRFGNPAYAFEELIAEMGAAFLCADHSVQGELRHAGYIGHWLHAMRADNKAVFKAAALAQKAADYIRAQDATAEAIAA